VTQAPYSLLLVDDNSWFIRIVSGVLASEFPGRLAVVGTARTSADAVALAAQLRPDVILLDLGLGRESGLDLIPRMATPKTSIVVLSLKDRSMYEPAALAAGADGFVAKLNLATDLWPAIERAVTARQGSEASRKV
jgi:DNA-binding NarL/FixJ family response regulator